MALQDDLRDLRARPAPDRARRRWDLVAAWCVILGPLVGIAIWLGFRQRVGDLEERLVRDANATFSRTFERPVHVDRPTPGTFGDAVVRHLPAIQRWADSVEDDAKAREWARDVVAGKRPFSELPAAYRVALANLSSDLDGLLDGTRAGRADLPIAREAWRPCDGTDWAGYQAAALLAGLRVRQQLAQGSPSAATSTCLDALALGRDAAITSGLVGHMVGAVIVRRLASPCAAALGRLPRSERLAAAGRVRVVRDGFPSVREMLRVEFLSAELLGFERYLPDDMRRRLVPRAVAAAKTADGESARGAAWWEPWAVRDGWRALRGTMDATLRLAESARGEPLEVGMRGLADAATRNVNPLAAIAMPSYAKFVGRAEEAARTLDALISGVPAAAR